MGYQPTDQRITWAQKRRSAKVLDAKHTETLLRRIAVVKKHRIVEVCPRVYETMWQNKCLINDQLENRDVWIIKYC